MTDLVLTCTGRDVDDALQPVGDPCGERFRRPARMVEPSDGSWPGWTNPVSDDAYIAHCRQAGWSVVDLDGVLHVTCPKCRRPTKAAVDLYRTIRP